MRSITELQDFTLETQQQLNEALGYIKDLQKAIAGLKKRVTMLEKKLNVKL